MTLPNNHLVIDCKWVSKAKYDAADKVDRYKGCLVARGLEKLAGIDYDKTYPLVVGYPSFRTLIVRCIQ